MQIHELEMYIPNYYNENEKSSKYIIENEKNEYDIYVAFSYFSILLLQSLLLI